MKVGQKYWQNLELMFLFLLDFSFVNLQKWRDQEMPRASWGKSRALPVMRRLLAAQFPRHHKRESERSSHSNLTLTSAPAVTVSAHGGLPIQDVSPSMAAIQV